MPTIHVIDDNELQLEIVVQNLRKAGYKVNPYSSGPEFLRDAQLVPPGCIVLDNAMPDLTGMQVQERMVGMNHGLPVIFMSGESSYEDVFTASRRGAFAFL